MFRYIFKEPPLTIKNGKAANPQAIGEAIAQHAAKHGGEIKTKNMLGEARARAHPMHPHIEWSDKLAAEHYRLDQVQELIRIVRRIDTNTPDELPVRAFHSINDRKSGDGRAYRSIDDVLASGELQLLLLQEAERNLQGWLARYGEIVEVCPLVERARVELADVISRLQLERQHKAKKAAPRRKVSGKRRRGSAENRASL